MTESLAVLFDVDNTLIDNDHVKAQLEATIEQHVGPQLARRFWELYEQVRHERAYVDFPWTLDRFAHEVPHHPGFPALADELLGYPYASALFPGAVDALAHASTLAVTAILSDGDPVYQPAKIARTGALDHINGPVLVFDHKERHLDEVRQRVPADHHVIVDDKPRILHAVKDALGARVTTLHVCQGKYAHVDEHDEHPDADITIEHIGEFRQFGLAELSAG